MAALIGLAVSAVRGASDAVDGQYCGWWRNPAPPKGWLKPYE